MVNGELFPVQIIICPELPADENIWLRSMRKGLKGVYVKNVDKWHTYF
jgi:hypothetical protein